MISTKVNQFVEDIGIEHLAKTSKFYKRSPRKITATNFVVSFFLVMTKERFSLRNWAIQLQHLIGEKVSFQAIAARLQFRQIKFVKQLFTESLRTKLDRDQVSETSELFKPFNRILLEDSTCIKLANKLFASFSGNSNSKVRKTITRVQLLIDLKGRGISDLGMTSYTINDGKYSSKIVEKLNPSDLIIRDLGYWSLRVFRSIDEKKAYYLSRLKLGVLLTDPMTGQDFDLLKVLKKCESKNLKTFESTLLVGAKEQVEMRVVAYKLTTGQSIKRIDQAKASRHKNVPISKKSKYLMTWNIMVTNVPKKHWSVLDIFTVYRMRWEIEMIFKNFKSNFHLSQLLASCSGYNPAKPELLLYLFMTFIVLVYNPCFKQYSKVVFKQANRFLSPYKFSQFLKQNFDLILLNKKKQIIDILVQFACYDRRKDRVNNAKLIYNTHFLS